MFNIPIANQHSYDRIPRGGDRVITNHCNAPSRQLVIDWKGDCFVCSCEAWLPISVGHVQDFARLEDIWNSPAAQELQLAMNSGSYTHCAVDRCGILNSNIYYDRASISINIDDSCNLACPSCRNGLRMVQSGEEYERKLAWVKHVVQLLEAYDQPARIIMSGNGDPLASGIMRPLLHSYRPQTQHRLRLFTNGLLLRKQLDSNPVVDHIDQYFISIDAGSAAVYEQVRQPGRFDVLLNNFTWLANTVQTTGAEVLLMFVLQSANWQDMENFAQLCIKFGFNGVINRLEDWGTWDRFVDQDVIGNCAHVEHAVALAELQRVYALYSDRIEFNASLVPLAKETT